MSWFEFNGRHCEDDMKVRYAPNAAERGGFFAKLDIQATEYSSRDGGTYHGTRRKPIDFALPCFYEEITRADKEKILRWLAPGAKGMLKLDDRPYCHYDVVIGGDLKIDEYPVTTPDGVRYSGIFTIYFVAYEPAAVLEVITADSGEVFEQTNAIPAAYMPAVPTTDSTEFFVYNPGDVETGLTIRVAGEGEVTFTNVASGQICKVVGLTDVLTTDAGKWITIDGEKLQTRYEGNATSEVNYAYHDDGYLSLIPGNAGKKFFSVSYIAGEGSVMCDTPAFQVEDIGKYIYLAGDWREIIYVQDEYTAETRWLAETSGTDVTMLAEMNRILVTRGDGAILSKLEIEYQPKVR